jgi:hypothetical protein
MPLQRDQRDDELRSLVQRERQALADRDSALLSRDVMEERAVTMQNQRDAWFALVEELRARIATLEAELEYSEPVDLVANGAPRGTARFHVGQPVGDWQPIDDVLGLLNAVPTARIVAVEIRKIPRHGGMVSHVIQARYIVRRAENDNA